MKKQSGITILGFIFFAIIFVVFSIITMKLVPIYIDNFYIRSAAKSLNELPDSALSGNPYQVTQTLIEKMQNQLAINEVRHLTRKDIKVDYHQNHYTVSIQYTRKVKLFGNLSAVVDFNEVQTVKSRGY